MRDTTKEITGKLVPQICRKGYMIMMVKNKLLFGKHKGRSVEIDKTPGKQTRNYERVHIFVRIIKMRSKQLQMLIKNVIQLIKKS